MGYNSLDTGLSLSSNITLSSANLKATASSSSTLGGATGVHFKVAGKWYFEVTVNATANATGFDLGIRTVGSTYSGMDADATLGAVLYRTGSIYVNGASQTALGSIHATNDVLQVAVDLDNNKIWFNKNNGNWNGSSSAHPNTNTGGYDLSGFCPGSGVYPFISLNNSNAGTFNFGASSFTYSPPSGFSGWDDADSNTVAIDVDSNATAQFSGSSSGSVTLPGTNGADRIVVVTVHADTTSGAVNTVSSISGGSLSWNKHKQFTFSGSAGTNKDTVEIWWAHASSALGSTSITVTMTGGIDDASIGCFAVAGADTTTPFDADGSIPGTATNTASSVASVSGISTARSHGILLGVWSNDAGPSGSTGPKQGSNYTKVSSRDNSGGSKWSLQMTQALAFTSAQSSVTVGTSNSFADWGMIATAIVEPQTATTSTIAQTLSSPTQSLTATEKEPSSIAQTLSGLTQSVSVTESEPSHIAMTLGQFTQSAIGASVTFSIAMTLRPFTQEVDAGETFSSAIAQTLDQITQALVATESDNAQIAQTLGSIAQEADGYVSPSAIISTQLFGLSMTEVVTESEPFSISQMLAGFLQQAHAAETFPSQIRTVLRHIRQRAFVPDWTAQSSKFLFAWVDDPPPFSEAFERVDEDIFAFEIRHEEGQVPTMSITIRNPRVGLLSADRERWAWLAYHDNNNTVVPLFCGMLVGIPSDLFGELITLSFVARSETYLEDKQAVAETMKVRPYYDPVFLDEKSRDEPDAILEGWSSLWHVDRITLATTASDVLVGEDGTVEFQPDMAYYDSVKMEVGEAPLTNIQVRAQVQWTQRTNGYVGGPPVNVSTFTGGSFIGEWPKPGASLGSGWSVAFSFCWDAGGTAFATTSTRTAHYKRGQQFSLVTSLNKSSAPVVDEGGNQVGSVDMASPQTGWDASPPADCEVVESTLSITGTPPGVPVGGGSHQENIGYCDPFADPPVNRPPSLSSSQSVALLWSINASWTLRYDAKRTYSELLVFDVDADTQPILSAPTVQQDTDVIDVSGADVGEPLVTPSAWSDFAGKSVDIAQLIFPNNPTTPGGLSYQICVQPGTAGTIEPIFSDIPGTTVDDGSVVWASLGQSPPTSASQWSAASYVPLGEIILLEQTALAQASQQFVTTGASTYYICTQAGQTNGVYHDYTFAVPPTSSDGGGEVVTITRIDPPDFTQTAGATIIDGSVTWTCLGEQPNFLGIPIGGTADNVTARCYFTSERGHWSIEHLICKARARLRLRSRAIKVSWECPFDFTAGLSCRKNATLFDPRLPGGVCTGKITSYSLMADQNGTMKGRVEIGVPVGRGGLHVDRGGDGVYASSGYMQRGYQQETGGSATLTDNNDIAYTAPVFVPFDDGLSFPLQAFPGQVRLDGTAAQQRAALQSVTITSKSFEQAMEQALEGSSTVVEVLIDPVQNGPFNGSYQVEVSTLKIPQGIDLSAASQD